MLPKRVMLFALSLLLTFSGIAVYAAEGAQQKGYEIAKSRKERDQGWGDSESQLRMILRDQQGNESSRILRTKALEVSDDGDKALTIFDQPRDVKGTAFLSISHIQESDEQWLFLPERSVVKRISSRQKSGSFVSSEFAYEDMTSFELERFTFKWLRDEELDGQKMHVIEATPTDKFSGYSHTITWVDVEEYRPFKTEYYDRRKKTLLKTATMSDYRLYLDKFWRPHRVDMVNHQTGKSTTLLLDSIAFKTGLDSNDFNKNSLKRAR